MATDQPPHPSGEPHGGRWATSARTETGLQLAPVAWPSFTTEALEWRSADADYGPRTGRSAHTGPYEAAVAPRIADVTSVRAGWGERIRARRGAAAWKLADLVRTRPVVDARSAAEKLGVSVVNAQLAIDRLVEHGVLEQVGNGTRDRVWQASEVLTAMDRFAERSHHRAW